MCPCCLRVLDNRVSAAAGHPPRPRNHRFRHAIFMLRSGFSHSSLTKSWRNRPDNAPKPHSEVFQSREECSINSTRTRCDLFLAMDCDYHHRGRCASTAPVGRIQFATVKNAQRPKIWHVLRSRDCDWNDARRWRRFINRSSERQFVTNPRCSRRDVCKPNVSPSLQINANFPRE